MTAARWYVTTAIPYVNAAPHLGHALEFVQTDTLARWRRLRGDAVRSLWGTDDNASKNVAAACAAGVDTGAFVDRQAQRFLALRDPLQLGFDDCIRTARDPRHTPAVQRLWQACRAAGDLYRDRYEGVYCPGCERFLDADQIRCAEHGAALERVAEDNWFFRLTRHVEPLRHALRSGQLRVLPAHRRAEVLAFLDGPVRDISVSRPTERSGGWGIGVPDDPSQTVYVWFDALANYISALGYGTGSDDYQRWWARADRRVHVVGKGITRFHAVYWPAFLLSAGEPLPTDVLVHEYLTAHGAKISKSAGASVAVEGLVRRYGTDAVRWWLLSDVNPADDTDFRGSRLVARHDHDLANRLGNLVNRVAGLARRAAAQRPPTATRASDSGPPSWLPLDSAVDRIDAAVTSLDLRTATAVLWTLVDACNDRISRTRPWELVADDARRDDLARELADLVQACRTIAHCSGPFLPAASRRISRACDAIESGGVPPRLFPRLAERGTVEGAHSVVNPAFVEVVD